MSDQGAPKEDTSDDRDETAVDRVKKMNINDNAAAGEDEGDSEWGEDLFAGPLTSIRRAKEQQGVF